MLRAARIDTKIALQRLQSFCIRQRFTELVEKGQITNIYSGIWHFRFWQENCFEFLKIMLQLKGREIKDLINLQLCRSM